MGLFSTSTALTTAKFLACEAERGIDTPELGRLGPPVLKQQGGSDFITRSTAQYIPVVDRRKSTGEPVQVCGAPQSVPRWDIHPNGRFAQPPELMAGLEHTRIPAQAAHKQGKHEALPHQAEVGALTLMAESRAEGMGAHGQHGGQDLAAGDGGVIGRLEQLVGVVQHRPVTALHESRQSLDLPPRDSPIVPVPPTGPPLSLDSQELLQSAREGNVLGRQPPVRMFAAKRASGPRFAP